MVRKLMALSALTFVTGIVTSLTAGGCTSETPRDDAPVPPDGGNERETSTRPPPGPEPEPDPGEACPKDEQLTAAQLEGDIGFKPATKMPGACAQADITQLEANFKDTNIKTYFDLGANLTDECKTCVFSKDTDTSWQPIVGTAANNGETGFINFGACFGSIEGEACGKALQFEQFCYNIACNECTTTSTERQKCVGVAGDTGGMCADFAGTTGTACPQLQTTAKECNSIFDAVKTLCAAPADAGAGDGGS